MALSQPIATSPLNNPDHSLMHRIIATDPASTVQTLMISDIGVRALLPATQTIAAGNTITANALGGIKRITAAGPVTTDTTNTFTAPSTANAGGFMLVVNVGAQAITLDFNALFVSAGAADVVLGAGDTVLVACDGSKWYQISATGNN